MKYVASFTDSKGKKITLKDSEKSKTITGFSFKSNSLEDNSIERDRNARCEFTFYGEKWYDGVSTTKENKRIYMEALCPYNNEKFRYVIHFLDANNMYEQKPCKLTDDVLIYKIFRVSHKSNEKKYIFLNSYYSRDDIEKYENIIYCSIIIYYI